MQSLPNELVIIAWSELMSLFYQRGEGRKRGQGGRKKRREEKEKKEREGQIEEYRGY